MKCIGAFSPSVSVQTGENIPGNVYTQRNLLAGKGIEIVDEPVEGGIDNHTLACWHFDGNLDNSVENSKFIIKQANVKPVFDIVTPKFGSGATKRPSGGYTRYIKVTETLTLDEYTIDFWLKDPVNDWIFGANSGYVLPDNIAIQYNSTYLSFYCSKYTIDVQNSVSNVNDGNWHHIAITADKLVINIFIDGIKRGEAIRTGKIQLLYTDNIIYSTYLDRGLIDELRISAIVRYKENFVPPTKPYSLAVPTGNKVINNTLDVSSLVTKEEVSTGLSTKQDTITGSNGEVAYHNGTSVFTQSILNLGYTCASAAEVNQCKNNAPSFSAVFNTWKKFSHKNATNDAIPSEMTAWTYDSGTDTITQPLNTESYVGFISPKSYSSYDITVRCYSTGSDDDSIGLVAAFAKDSNGLEHTLSFIRSPGGTSAKWVAILDYNQFALTGTSYGQKILVNNSAASTTPASTASWNTESIGTGTVIKMVRSGNVITAKCSQFNSNTIDDNTLITVDLDALSDENPTLNLFKGSSPWGYSNFSQPNSKYENISVTDPDGMIFDIPNNQVLQYSNGTWVVVSGQTPISAIGAGRLSYNSVTGKLFFCTGTDIIQIGKNTDI